MPKVRSHPSAPDHLVPSSALTYVDDPRTVRGGQCGHSYPGGLAGRHGRICAECRRIEDAVELEVFAAYRRVAEFLRKVLPPDAAETIARVEAGHLL